jgi:DNA mismatch repair protein MutS2
MGLPGHVLARAQALLGQTSLGLEEVLRNLEERESALTRSLEALDEARVELEERAADQKAAAQSLAKREKELALRSREAVDAAVRDARAAISDIVRDVRQRRTPEAAAEARRALEQKAAEATRDLPERPALDLERLRDALASRSLGVAQAAAGKPAWGKGQGSSGGKGTSGGRPTQGPGAQAPGTPAPGAPSDPEIVLQTSWNTLDLRGRRADEALGELEVFLDKAVLDAADAVIVIHGHGTGALRKVVREALATSAYVERFRPGGPREGGDGVSVVTVRG